ncbi:hypothetical protein L2E82_50471 [Cichorium intybus]|nr:hypothetical protein L2E82_50471 [Cichorium intybus]
MAVLASVVVAMKTLLIVLALMTTALAVWAIGTHDLAASVDLSSRSRFGEEGEFLSITCLCVRPTSTYQVYRWK